MKADICHRNINSTITVSWDETVCSLVENYQCFRAICCLQLSWRWRQKVTLKHWQLPTVLHGIKFQKAVIFIFPITRTSNPTYLQGFLHHWITEEGLISQNCYKSKSFQNNPFSTVLQNVDNYMAECMVSWPRSPQ